MPNPDIPKKLMRPASPLKRKKKEVKNNTLKSMSKKKPPKKKSSPPRTTGFAKPLVTSSATMDIVNLRPTSSLCYQSPCQRTKQEKLTFPFTWASRRC